MDYESVKKLIEENAGDVCEDFAPFGEAASDLWIQRAETRLGVKFPPSYVWWLKNYGGGTVYGDEVYGIVYESDYNIYESDPTKDLPSNDIVFINESSQKDGWSSKDQLIIQDNDQAEIYYFDLNQMDQNREYPVYIVLGAPLAADSDFPAIKYADNFLDFLEKNIQNTLLFTYSRMRYSQLSLWSRFLIKIKSVMELLVRGLFLLLAVSLFLLLLLFIWWLFG